MKAKNIMLAVKNSRLGLTGVAKIIMLSFTIIILSGSLVSAMTFQDSVDVRFTFNTSLSLSLSSSNITIAALAPGGSAYSNTIIVTVNTNNFYGYTLSAMVGGTGQTVANNTLYNSTTSTSFTSLASDASTTLANFQNNTWGYTTATSINSSTAYSGLSYNVEKIINKTTNRTGTADTGYPGTNSTSFTVGAKASTTQPAGSYSNVVTFVAVSNAAPRLYMQEVTASTLASLMPDVGNHYTLYDRRDEKAYTVTKLADGKYWMTSDLNLAGGTKLDSNNSDVPAGYTQSSPYFTLPASGVIASGTNLNSNYFSNSSTAYVFNTGNETDICGVDMPCNSYYSWIAATAGGKNASGNAVTANGYNAVASICPKGWRLPVATTANADPAINSNWMTGDFYNLLAAYGIYFEGTTLIEGETLFFENTGPGTTTNFLYNGNYHDGIPRYTDTSYWLATAKSSTQAYTYFWDFHNTETGLHYFDRKIGNPVRCVFGS